MQTGLVATGSVKDVALKSGKSLAHAFLGVKIIILADRSGSMDVRDAMGDKARYQVEDDLVSKLQRQHMGQVLLASFKRHRTNAPEWISTRARRRD